MPDLLANEAGFKGPYATPEKDLSSVETPDDRTLIFHFSGPQPDADWIMSLPYTAPVPKDKDTRQDYANRPMASGPYKIDTYERGTALAPWYGTRTRIRQRIPIGPPTPIVFSSN